MLKIYSVLFETFIVKKKKIFNINLEDEIIEKSLIREVSHGNKRSIMTNFSN